MGQRKFVLGRVRKNHEKIRQQMKGKKPGRPRKSKKVCASCFKPVARRTPLSDVSIIEDIFTYNYYVRHTPY